MKKGIYSVKVEMDESSRTRQASCDCPAGVDGRCNHLAATLFMLESLDYNENKENSVLLSQEQLPNIPCTSKLCTWNVPKRAEKIKKLEEETGMKTGLSFILPQNIVTSEQELSPPSETGSSNVELPGSRWLLVSPNKSLPLSLEEIKAKSERTKRRLLESVDDRAEIIELTVDQHQSEVWYHVRQPRITAPRCKRCLLKPTTSPTKAIADVLNYQPMKDGIASEAGIVKRYDSHFLEPPLMGLLLITHCWKLKK